jgi:hypothetical protein
LASALDRRERLSFDAAPPFGSARIGCVTNTGKRSVCLPTHRSARLLSEREYDQRNVAVDARAK